MMRYIIGPALIGLCVHWIIRYAVRAELKRAGILKGGE